ncbi:hypothetical protein T265_11327 [Opisthorchis viverrini]|uniref:Uncharacterized protein n=1 Tax=Opisthorchis viverrini TaxID=6198 RepID=A0A074YZ16_OPIVI|nr:hypothetical protein T265_11327 [Opisthorchis viverrini]KER20036.1 hypothetical protein T265_11327 [Opisthorchis viverrini]
MGAVAGLNAKRFSSHGDGKDDGESGHSNRLEENVCGRIIGIGKEEKAEAHDVLISTLDVSFCAMECLPVGIFQGHYDLLVLRNDGAIEYVFSALFGILNYPLEQVGFGSGSIRPLFRCILPLAKLRPIHYFRPPTILNGIDVPPAIGDYERPLPSTA